MRRGVFKARFLWLVAVAMLVGVGPMAAQASVGAPNLGSAADFAVLAGTALTCTDSNVAGPVGVNFPVTEVTSTRCKMQVQFAPGAYGDFLTAYSNMAATLTPCTVLTGTLAGVSLGSGTYCFDAAATLTGTLTLTGSGPWIFEIGTLAYRRPHGQQLHGGQQRPM